ncbi:MAG: sulfatase-like hydrolase/transferase [Treponema sp.]|nr:sulfatase-like hydrolase/transferase [Treponema sp.]
MNILLITTDQQRFDMLGAVNTKIKTPNLDKLAAEGIVYTKAYTPCAVCTPARVSILTGHLPSRHGCFNIGVSLPDDYPTIPALLAKNGYFTSLIGKSHFHSWRTPESFESIQNSVNWDFFRNWQGPFHGFEYTKLAIGHSSQDFAASMHYGLWLKEQGITDFKPYFGREPYVNTRVCELEDRYSCTAWIGGETINAIDKSLESGKPFFIWSSFLDPHAPITAPEPWASLHNPADMPVYGYVDGEMDNKPPFYKSLIEGNLYGKDDPELQRNNWTVTGVYRGADEEKRHEMAVYYGMLSQIDHHVGLIMDHLKARGLYGDTLIIFTADHGDMMGHHGLRAKGMPAFEDSQKIPFIVRHPHCRTPDAFSTARQDLTDIGRSVLSAAGIAAPAGLQGFDQSESWINADVQTRPYNYLEYKPAQSAFAQRTFIYDDYKLVFYHNRPYGELYNLAADPDQYDNLWDKSRYAEKKNELLGRLISAQIELEGELRPRTASS